MNDVTTTPHALIDWYRNHVRPLLAEFVPQRVAELDGDVPALLKAIEACGEQPAVCVLGHSGVGKSTLINALVAGARIILPQGGIGPLTAQATSVCYAEQPYFEAQYFGRNELNRVRFALEKALDPELAEDPPPSDDPDDEGETEAAGDPAPTPDGSAAVTPAPGAADEDEDGEGAQQDAQISRRQQLTQQARLLITGDQYGSSELRYLVDALRIALGNQPRWGSQISLDDMARIERLRQCIGLAKDDRPYRRDASNEARELQPFLNDLQTHASGFLAPLIRTLQVGWNAPILRDGLVMVDLPGLGIAKDQYRRVTQAWVRERARGIGLVVDRGGLTEESADLLRSSGFLTRLLHSADDPTADPMKLVIVVVKLDLSADDSRQQEKAQLGTARRWVEHFNEACAKARHLVLQQLRAQLEAFVATQRDDYRADAQEVVSRVLDEVEVYPVAAKEFRLLMQGDEDEPAKIKVADESNIPALAEALRAVATEHRARLQGRVAHLVQELTGRIGTSLELLEAEWMSDERAAEEVERLRQELEPELEELRRGLYSRQGAFRNFLRETLPGDIENLVDFAGQTAQRGMEEYVGDLGLAHWATLRAAVRKGGTHVGVRHVDIPQEFAVRFEEPVAMVWSRKILGRIRSQTSDLAGFYVDVVGKIATWAEGQGTRVQPRLIRALHEEIKGDMKRLDRVGKEAVDELRAKVKSRLFDVIERPIRSRCKKFVDDGQHIGTGTKWRILQLFRSLIPQSVDAAKSPATKTLLENFREVEAEITEVFDKYPDPLTAAADTILAAEGKRIERSDARNRARVLEAIRTAWRTRPDCLPPDPSQQAECA